MGNYNEDWINVRKYGAGGDGYTDDTAAIQSAINAASPGDTVYFPAGAYKVFGPLLPASGVRLTGASQFTTTVFSLNSSVINAGAAFTDRVEIDHLALSATGSDLFTGANVARWHVHHCALTQNSAGKAIWNANPVGLMIECVFDHNSETVFGATRTIDAWYLLAPSNSANVNACAWRDNVCTNHDNDASEYWYHLIGGTAGTTLNRQNVFQNIVFEHPYGGMILLESCAQTLIEGCLAWDTSSTVMADLIKLVKNSGGGTPVTNTVRQCGAVSATLNAGVSTISTDANCSGTLIQSPLPSSVISLNGSLRNTLAGLPGTYTLNLGGATFADSYGTAKAAAAPFTSSPTAPASTTSATLVMMGLGTNATGTPWAFTPQSSGNVLVIASGVAGTATAAATVTIGGRYGTGAASANGVAVTGTRFGSAGDIAVKGAATGNICPFTLSQLLSLTPGTAYWFDLAISTGNASDAASLADVSITVIELS